MLAGLTNFEIVDAVDGKNASIPDSEVKRQVLRVGQDSKSSFTFDKARN